MWFIFKKPVISFTHFSVTHRRKLTVGLAEKRDDECDINVIKNKKNCILFGINACNSTIGLGMGCWKNLNRTFR